jgi:hypothetical protein
MLPEWGTILSNFLFSSLYISERGILSGRLGVHMKSHICTNHANPVIRILWVHINASILLKWGPILFKFLLSSLCISERTALSGRLSVTIKSYIYTNHANSVIRILFKETKIKYLYELAFLFYCNRNENRTIGWWYWY